MGTYSDVDFATTVVRPRYVIGNASKYDECGPAASIGASAEVTRFPRTLTQ